ncbi:nuclear transport factor 2 family protein [Vibrio sp. SCSIO 43135]|uniref:YybH family protein n=1 Tax=Vibrio sp. SCSIO 43135 TaxID=2819096 RepID=UPI002074BE25|nr:nuclear transport factor 2 family protein [Vibrio sp. SCSIO 43135]USD42679.1 nuclear transport factor 2 family protein [Vibrio sp. SCSIO 43135]
MKVILALLLSSLSFLAFGANEYKKPQTPSELHELFGYYFAKKDMEGLASLFHPSAVLITDESGSQAEGREAIISQLETYMEGESSMTTHSVSIHVNGDTALVRSDWEITGGQKGMALEVMTYENGGWGYVIDNPNGF